MISVSLVVMLMMTGLSMSLLAMAIRARTAEKMDLLPLSVSITLIFGLPGAPQHSARRLPVGAIVDFGRRFDACAYPLPEPHRQRGASKLFYVLLSVKLFFIHRFNL